LTRRSYLKSVGLAGAAVSAPSAAMAGRKPPAGGIKFTEIFSPGQTERFRLARQMGIGNAIAGVSGALSKVRREQYVAPLTQIKSEFAASGLAIAGVESHPVPAEKIKLGLPGRDEEIENYKAAIVALKRVGIPMICYNWMAGLGW